MPGKPEKPISNDEPDGTSVAESASATTLADLITPERVLCNVTARSKKHSLEIVARLLTNDQDSLTEAEVFDTIYQRENLGGTGLGKGFALPHGRVEDLEHSVGAFLMLTQPVDFEAGEGVDMIFALAVPLNSNEEHLKDLSAIANLLSNTDVRGKVSHLISSRDIHKALIELSASINT
jgi:PTS system nitrogen regulatory IIA component